MTYFQNFWTSEMAEEEQQQESHPLLKPWPGYAVPTMLARRYVFTDKSRPLRRADQPR